MLLAAVAVGGCATLSTAGMSAECSNLYNACLDGCPKPRQAADPHDAQLDFDTPSCVDACNRNARGCR